VENKNFNLHDIYGVPGRHLSLFLDALGNPVFRFYYILRFAKNVEKNIVVVPALFFSMIHSRYGEMRIRELWN